jgi:hypothetical protein
MMEPLHRFAYTSTLSPMAGPQCVIDIVRTARRRNRELEVTGILIFDGWAFLQFLEGPRTSIQSVVESIHRDSRHQGVTRLTEGLVSGRRRFGDWSMAYAITHDEIVVPALAARQGVGLELDLERLIPDLDMEPWHPAAKRCRKDGGVRVGLPHLAAEPASDCGVWPHSQLVAPMRVMTSEKTWRAADAILQKSAARNCPAAPSCTSPIMHSNLQGRAHRPQTAPSVMPQETLSPRRGTRYGCI